MTEVITGSVCIIMSLSLLITLVSTALQLLIRGDTVSDCCWQQSMLGVIRIIMGIVMFNFLRTMYGDTHMALLAVFAVVEINIIIFVALKVVERFGTGCDV